MSELEEKRISGRCLCGAVQFELQLPVRFCAHCHCSICRRAHGAPLVTFCGVPLEQFTLLEGDEVLTRYESSPGAVRSFCGRCGSTLLFEAERWPGEVHVAVSNLEGTLEMRPMAHVFFDDRAHWFEPGDSLPRLGGESGVEPVSG